MCIVTVLYHLLLQKLLLRLALLTIAVPDDARQSQDDKNSSRVSQRQLLRLIRMERHYLMKEDGGDEEGGNGLERGVGGDDGRVNVLVAPQLHMMETRCTCHEEVGGDGVDQHVVREAPQARYGDRPRGGSSCG